MIPPLLTDVEPGGAVDVGVLVVLEHGQPLLHPGQEGGRDPVYVVVTDIQVVQDDVLAVHDQRENSKYLLVIKLGEPKCDFPDSNHSIGENIGRNIKKSVLRSHYTHLVKVLWNTKSFSRWW